jgi:hypothetical protein
MAMNYLMSTLIFFFVNSYALVFLFIWQYFIGIATAVPILIHHHDLWHYDKEILIVIKTINLITDIGFLY